MSDLISKSKLIEEILEEANTKILDLESGITLGEMKEWVDNQPTVEAVPVVHGEWINEYINRYGHPCHCCSVCGFHASHQDKNFCPECGTDMRKKV